MQEVAQIYSFTPFSGPEILRNISSTHQHECTALDTASSAPCTVDPSCIDAGACQIAGR